MIAARAAQPLNDAEVTAALAPLLHGLSDQVDRSLRTLAAAYTGGGELPDLSGLDAAVTSIDAAVAKLRERGEIRALPTETVASIFTLTFSLRQLGPNIHDLSDRLADLKDRTSQPAPVLD
jgi:hypothetical protein